MQNFQTNQTTASDINLSDCSSSTQASTVVQNDTEKRIPSIKLDQINAPSQVIASGSATEAALTALTSMEAARNSWETTELAASNKRLYSILSDAYGYYLAMKNSKEKSVRDDYSKALNQFIAIKEYKFIASTHDMTRVVKCVFGIDRRRVSAYSIALREALRQSVAAVDLSEFLEQNGGVEQIRLGGTKPLSAKVRADQVKDEVVQKDLGTLKFDTSLITVDAEWTDKQVVIVATYLPTGEFQANAVIKNDTAVNAALAAYYSQIKAKQRVEERNLRAEEKRQLEERMRAEDAKAKNAATVKAVDADEHYDRTTEQCDKLEEAVFA